MLTDWVLIYRLAVELKERLRGARAEDAGLLEDGRIGIVVRSQRRPIVLAIDLFTSPPLVTLEEGELGIQAEPGFVRVLARSLRGMVLADIGARRNDRLLRLTFASRSRFGVGDRFELYIELVPRFGNLVLVKDGGVVAASKEFAPAENHRRSVQPGGPYELPPLPERIRTLAPIANADEPSPAAPLFVYRRDGQLLQAYPVPLEGYEDARLTREPSLLVLFAELHAQRSERADSARGAARRRTIVKRLDERRRKLLGELDALARKRQAAAQRASVREEGEAIFATLHELPEGARDAAKERAAKLFTEYKRLGKSLPHVDEREAVVARTIEAVEMLRWEAERADDLDAVESAVAELGPKRRNAAIAPEPRRKRPPLEFRTARGSRILVGRSPTENAELTFRVARPNDLWFHAQRVPGAHVILSRDDRATVSNEDIETAAGLAAFHSRARAATAVPVDYTLRKHVRKQRAAPPGLVWYTHAKTVVVEPKTLAPA
ncbi:MAG TPA: NFACT RNA binding domain-containing protein [Candidatus Cybelea sp.]|jgi:predicted ribosome quality control (RQC) complex YloA/Tae2 family protein|nr:NFACT RNA binding domain-containing protein [Candidatus Cybelea sp.]